MKKYGYRALCVLGALATASCGGGGGSTLNSPPVPTASPAPTATPGAGAACASSARASGGRLASHPSASSWIVPNRVYVTYRSGAGASASRAVDSAARAVTSVALGDDGAHAHRLITLPPTADAGATTAALRQTAGVESVSPVHVRVTSGDSVANDPYLETTDQWYLYITNTDPGAWQLTHGRSGVSVAVIDTGVDETNTDFALDVRESIVSSVKTVGAGAAQDTNGHGTNVAALSTATTNNGYGFAGVGYATHLQAYRIFPDATASSDCQTADTGDEATAIRDAVANGASVINLSLGAPQSSGFDQAESDAIAFAIANNVTVVAAAGNEFGTSDGAQPDYPGAYPGVIAVGASAVQDRTPNSYASITSENVASYSNSGPTLLAPGGDATSTNDGDILHWIENYSTTTAAYAPDRCSNAGGVCRALFNGTSQATPQVAGTVALMEAYHGGARSLSPAQVRTLLVTTADVLSGVAAERQGAGRLDTARAVAAAHP